MNKCSICKGRDGNPKTSYPTEELAELAAEKLRDNGVPIRTYECPIGEGWHLSSQNAQEPERPKNIMTKEDKRLYSTKSKKNKTRIYSSLNEDSLAALAEFKEKAKENTPAILKKHKDKLHQELSDIKKDWINKKKLYEMSERNNDDSIVLKECFDEANKKLLNARQKYKTANNQYLQALKRTNKK